MEQHIDQLWIFLQNHAPRAALAVIVLIIGIIIIKLLKKVVKKALKNSHLDQTAHKMMLQIFEILMVFVLLIIAAETLGIKTSSLVTILGAAGVAVSLALKDSLGNVAGGILILFSKPFIKGNFIETNSVSGTVYGISLFYTVLRTPDNKRVYIPNGEIATAKITNYSSEETRRLDVTFSVSYGTDTDKVKEILKKCADGSGLVLSDPEPKYLVTKYGDHAIDVVARLWVNSPDYWTVNFYMLDAVKKEFDEAGIVIPFNQLDVHFDK